MIQGGGFTDDMKQKPTQAPIKNEADTGIKNDRGTIAMARTGDPHSATGQFFINTVDNDFLNHKNKTPQGWGYAAFGKVIKGMETVDAISAVKTSNRGSYQDVPVEAVVIKSAKRLK
jgi:peptidyl-prolyl cis-trans isomerase B (cyclophilin B)